MVSTKEQPTAAAAAVPDKVMRVIYPLFKDFDKREKPLRREELLRLVEQAILLFELSYTHLPQKRAMYAIDPVQRLRLLKNRIERALDTQLPAPVAFHNEMIEIFNQARDLHTNYIPSGPFNEVTVFLPFLIERYLDEKKQARFIVTAVDKHNPPAPPLDIGAEITHWNGIPMQRAVELNANREAGSNPDARFQRGLSRLTIRPLSRSLPPDEEWVVLDFVTADQAPHQARYDWFLSIAPPEFSAEIEAKGTGESLGFGFDLEWAREQDVRKVLFAKDEALRVESQPFRLRADYIEAKEGEISPLTSLLPLHFRAQVKTADGQGVPFDFGYIRVYSFMYPNADQFVDEFARLMRLLPQDGLVIDVRNNGGGNILACERLLQLLSPNPIDPARFQFINSPLTLALAERYLDLFQWAPSIAQSVQTGTLHSLSFTITSDESLAAVRKRHDPYRGPKVLITDGLCYSATDIFAAGFQDHKLGKILGTFNNTGAGGANVWTHSDLYELVQRLERNHPMREAFKPLPRGAQMRVSIRRCLRVKENAGIPLEDLGVVPDKLHPLTKQDLLYSNRDLLDQAGALLRGQDV